jgi:hypothetical protein
MVEVFASSVDLGPLEISAAVELPAKYILFRGQDINCQRGLVPRIHLPGSLVLELVPG